MRFARQLNADSTLAKREGCLLSNKIAIMQNKKWTFTDAEGVIHEVELERWSWGVVYNDGTELHQFAADGVFHRIGEVEQERAIMFVLYRTDDMNKRIDIVLPEGAKLIHKYRNFIFSAGTKEEFRKRVYMFGYKHKGNSHFNFVMPDDRIVQSTTDKVKLTEFNVSK